MGFEGLACPPGCKARIDDEIERFLTSTLRPAGRWRLAATYKAERLHLDHLRHLTQGVVVADTAAVAIHGDNT